MPEDPQVGGLSAVTRYVSDVMSAVKRQFGDEAGVQLEDADIIRWINDAQNTINNRNRILKATSVSQSTAGQTDYTFPDADILQVESITYNNVLIPDVPFGVAQERISNMDPQLAQTGTPRFWYMWAGHFTFWPIPDAAQNITLFYTRKPDVVTQSTDLLSVPDKYFETVVAYVMQQAYELDEDWQAVQAKQQQFEAAINQFGEEERTAQNMTYETINLMDGEDIQDVSTSYPWAW